MTELERAEKLREKHPAKARESPARERAHHLQTLQQTRGNAAVGRHLQREPARERAPLARHHAFEFRIGGDVPAALARAAKEAAGDAPLAQAQLRRLQRVARDNGGVSDTQRMFLAGLLDADNVRRLSRTAIEPGTTVGFSLQSIRAGMPHVKSLGRRLMPTALVPPPTQPGAQRAGVRALARAETPPPPALKASRPQKLPNFTKRQRAELQALEDRMQAYKLGWEDVLDGPKAIEEIFARNGDDTDRAIGELIALVEEVHLRRGDTGVPGAVVEDPRDIRGTSTRTGRSERSRHTDPRDREQAHHGLPEYLGGDYYQTLIDLPDPVHYQYHQEVDRLLNLPRKAGSAYYDALTPDERREIYQRLLEHAKKFDKEHYREYTDKRTRIHAALRRGIKEANWLRAWKSKSKSKSSSTSASAAKELPPKVGEQRPIETTEFEPAKGTETESRSAAPEPAKPTANATARELPPRKTVPVRSVEGGASNTKEAPTLPETPSTRASVGPRDMNDVHVSGPNPTGVAIGEGAAQLLVDIEQALEREAVVRDARRAGSLRTYRWWLQRGIEPPAKAVYDRWIFWNDETDVGTEPIGRRIRSGRLDGIEVGLIDQEAQYKQLEDWARANVHSWDDFYRHFVASEDAGVRWRDGRWETIAWKWSDVWPANVYPVIGQDKRIEKFMEEIRAEILGRTAREAAALPDSKDAFAPGSSARVAGKRVFRKGFVDRDFFTPALQIRLSMSWGFTPVFYEITGVPDIPDEYTLVAGADLSTSIVIHEVRAGRDKSTRPTTASIGPPARYDNEHPYTGFGPVNVPCILVEKESLTSP